MQNLYLIFQKTAFRKTKALLGLLVFFAFIGHVPKAQAQACVSNTFAPVADYVGNTYPAYRFYHADGTHAPTFYRDETIYSFDNPTISQTCRSASAQQFITPNLPAEATALCTPVKNSKFWIGLANNTVTSYTCQKVGPLQYVMTQQRNIKINTVGTYHITYSDNSTNTVDLKIVGRLCVKTDCGTFGGQYIQTGLKNNKPDLFDEDNNEIFFDADISAWVMTGVQGTPFKLNATVDFPTTTNWQVIAGSVGVGFLLSMTESECIDDHNYTVKATITDACEWSGVYEQVGIVNGKPKLASSNGYFQYDSSISEWFFYSNTGIPLYGIYSISYVPPTTGWFKIGTNNSYPCNTDMSISAVVKTPLPLTSPLVICVQTTCGNAGGQYTQTRNWNERPDLYDADQNRLFYWGSGSTTHLEGWYIRDKDDKSLYYNPSTSTTVPTTGWVPFTGDGVTCDANITIVAGVNPTVSIVASPSGAIDLYTKVTFTATPTNGGTSPSYQWKKNNVNVGTNSAIYVDANLAFDDVVKVTITSDAVCPANAISNEIKMDVGSPCLKYTAQTITGIKGVANTDFTAHADVDGDNDQDILIVGQSYAKLFTNDGHGNFTLVSGTPFTGTIQGTVNFEDIDDDNDQDVFITGSGTAKLYTNDGHGNFTLVPNTPFPNIYTSAVAFADVDTDGDKDVIISGSIGVTIVTQLYTNDGAGNFSLVNGTPFIGVFNGTVSFADIDNDNNQDVLITGVKNNSGSYTSNLYTNNGNGIFTLVNAPFIGINRGSVGFMDVDNDNDLDVFIVGTATATGATNLYLNNGTGTFTKSSNPLVNSYESGQIIVADINGDNFKDLLFSATNNGGTINPNSIDLYTNNGNGTFKSITNSNLNADGLYSFVFDVDGDGYVDIFNVGSVSAKFYKSASANPVTPTVAIASNATGRVAVGTSINLTATPTNGGTSQYFVWKKNGNVIPNENASTLTSTTFADGDIIKVEMSSNVCTTTPSVTSNELTIAVGTPQNYCVQVECGLIGGNSFTLDATTSNNRPQYKFFDTQISYQTTTGPNGEGWYIFDNNQIFYYYNASSNIYPPTTGWVAIGNNCTSTLTLSEGTCLPIPPQADLCISNTCNLDGLYKSGDLLSNNRPVYSNSNNSGIMYGLAGNYFLIPTNTFTKTGWYIFNPFGFSSHYYNPSNSTTFPTTGWQFEGTPSPGCTPNITIGNITPSVTLASNDTDNNITAGTSVTFTATPTNGGTTPTYVWKKNNVVIPNEASVSYTTTTLVNGDKIKVEMTSNDACASTDAVISNEITMVVTSACTSPPTATISYAGSPFCGSAVNALPTITGTTGGFFRYTDATDDINIDGATGAISSSVPATYHIVYTIEAVNGCPEVTATTSVIVNALPTVTASSNSPICARTTLNLLGGVQSTPSFAVGDTYTWTGVNSFSSALQNPSINSATTLATGTYRVVVTNSNGCTASATTSVIVNALPTVTASSNSPICAGTGLNLLSSVGTSYAWTGVNSFSSTLQNPSINSATTLATGTYKVVVTNSNGCTASATTSVIVNALPSATASSNSPICAGTSLNLLGGVQSTPSFAVGDTYAWTGVNSFSSALQNPSINSATTLATGTYKVVVTNSNGCTASATTSVIVNALPTATASSNSPICAGTTLNLLGGVQSTPSFVAGDSYAWTGVNSFSSALQNPSINSATTLATGTYKVVVTNSNGCTASATTSVIVNAIPTATASSNSPICAGTTLNLLGGVQGNIPSFVAGDTYAWTGVNSFSSALQNPSINSATTLATGTYKVVVTNSNGCTASATTSLIVNALPTATASSNSPICAGTTLNLLGGVQSTPSFAVGDTYVWTGVNSFSSTLQNPSINSATTLATGTYKVVVTNSNGCTASATTSVIVNPTPVTPTTQADAPIIFGNEVSLTATGCEGTLKWYQKTDDVLVTMPVSPAITAQYYTKCEVTANGITCISEKSNNVSVIVLKPIPPVAVAATICIGSSNTLNATGCVGISTLKWYQKTDSTLVSMPVSPSVSTDYFAKCEQIFKGVTAISAKSNIVTLTVLNPSIPTVTAATIYKGNSISLIATGCTGEGFTVKWYETASNNLVTMPISPSITTEYYAKCEQSANDVICISEKSENVIVKVVNRIFVDITKASAPTQNGNSWATAFGNLQSGLTEASNLVLSVPTEVWVAKGIYKPTSTTDRNANFNIPSNVRVYGGFIGSEDVLNDRNFRTNSTILSGEIGNIQVNTDNTYHVVIFDNSSVNTQLDGFTITGGYANFDFGKTLNLPVINTPLTTAIERGGGIVLQNGANPTIANCIIANNAAIIGAGIHANASSPQIINCKFMGNQATFGAAIFLQDGSNPNISNTLLSGNRGVGALYNNANSNPILSNCTFAGNGGYNGGIFNSNSQPVVKNSILWGNTSPLNDTQSIISYTIIQGGYPGVGNLNYDPQFVNPIPEGISPNLNGDYHLKASSLGIDRGDNGTISLTDLDLDGNLRRFNAGRVDMGAFEFQGNATASLVISISSGDWKINSTWDVGREPRAGDAVIIDQNHTVTLDGEGNAKNIEYRGTGKVKFATSSAKLNLGL